MRRYLTIIPTAALCAFVALCAFGCTGLGGSRAGTWVFDGMTDSDGAQVSTSDVASAGLTPSGYVSIELDDDGSAHVYVLGTDYFNGESLSWEQSGGEVTITGGDSTSLTCTFDEDGKMSVDIDGSTVTLVKEDSASQGS